MTVLFRYFSASLLLLLASCAHWEGMEFKGNEEEYQTERQFSKSLETIAINKAEKALAQQNYSLGYSLFKSFQDDYPRSVFFQSSRIGEAQALEYMEKWFEAGELYRDIYKKTLTNQPEIAAISLYRLSFVYESLGEDLKTLTSLLDAKKKSELLPREISLAAIPARLGVAYSRLNRQTEAVKYLDEAEKGIDLLRQENLNLDLSWLSQLYFQMGSISTNQVTVDNYEEIAAVQKLFQVYLLKAMRLNHPQWSQRALTKAQRNYQDLFNIFASPLNDQNKKVIMGGNLVDLVEQANIFRPVQSEDMNNFEKEFFAYLEELRKSSISILYKSKEINPLTEESQRLHSLKWLGKPINLTPISEKDSESSSLMPIAPSEDPNL